jgi:hypothetical protein
MKGSNCSRRAKAIWLLATITETTIAISERIPEAVAM